jgi:hypothetical protein
VVCWPGWLGAQAPASPKPTPEDKRPKGFVRLWNMLPKGTGNLLLLLKNDPPGMAPIATAEPGNFYAGYQQMPQAQYSYIVVREGDRKVPIEHFEVILRENVYVTFLATLEQGKPKVQLIDDTYDPTTVSAGRLTVRNYFPDARISVAGGDGKTQSRVQSKALGTGESEVLDGFNVGSVAVQMKAALPDGKTQQWSSDIDFRISKHASLLVVPDPYGRFRPRVSYDGATVAPTDTKPRR